VDNVGLKICLLGTSNFMVTLTFFFLGVNHQSGPGTTSTTNHNFYRPWDDFMVPSINNPSMSGEFLGSKSQCFQVQSFTCSYLLITPLLTWVYSIDSSQIWSIEAYTYKRNIGKCTLSRNDLDSHIYIIEIFICSCLSPSYTWSNFHFLFV